MEVLNNKLFEKPSCKFKFLAKEGFNIPNYYEVSTVDEVLATYKEYIKTKRDLLSYDIDGLVEEVNNFDIQQELGYQPNGLDPNFAVGIKFDSVASVTPLVKVDWNTGMTGKVVPRAWFDPVDIMGVTVEKATLHNFEFIDNLIKKEGLRIGSECIVVRSGDVIPQMLGVKTVGNGTQIQIPNNCPVCNSALKRFSVELVCENQECGAKIKGIFTNYFDTLKIKGLSDKFIDKAIETYNIKSIKNLLELTVEQIEQLEGFADKSAKKAFDAIHSVKEVSPEQFMALLNIPNQGVRVFENLFNQFPIEKLLDENFKPSDILNTKGIAEITANAIYQGIKNNLHRLRENAEFFTIITKKNIVQNTNQQSQKMIDKNFCITGALNNGKRDDYETMIKNKGGLIGSVNKKLDYLVTNDTDTNSSKMKKAIELNSEWQKSGDVKRIYIISENDLITMMEN